MVGWWVIKNSGWVVGLFIVLSVGFWWGLIRCFEFMFGQWFPALEILPDIVVDDLEAVGIRTLVQVVLLSISVGHNPL